MKKQYNLNDLKNRLLATNKAFLMAIIMCVVLGLFSDVFLTQQNLLNLLRQMSTNCLVALGFTYVICFGEIDLSIGAVAAFSGVIMAMLMKSTNMPIALIVCVGIGIGAVSGLVNALIISIFDLPAFVVTLATQSLFRGLVYIITDMTAITGLDESFIFLGQGYLVGVPVPVLIMIIFVVVEYLLANHTIFGRYVVACGGNSNAATASGINKVKTRFAVYVNSGICVSIAAVIMTARTASAQVGAGLNWELDAIASVVMGGTALNGGKMNLVGTIFGALVIALTSNGLNLLGVSTNYQIIAKGVLILLALILDVSMARFYDKLRKKESLAALNETK